MLELGTLRQEIDEVDEQILALLNLRAQLVQKVAHWKEKQQRSVRDNVREQQIVARLQANNAGPLTGQQVEDIFRFFFQIFRQLEQREINNLQAPPVRSINRIGILGAGLMGGSFALAIEKFLPSCQVSIFDIKEKNIAGSVERIEDLFITDLLILAIPVQGIIDFLTYYGPRLPSGLMVLDLGSTKEAIVKAGEKSLPENVIFIGGHPLAGKERSGLTAAEADLYWERTFLLTPTQKSTKEAMTAIYWLLGQIGARIVEVSADRHDRILACTSHLPQMLAVLLALVAKEQSGHYSDDWGLGPFVGRSFLESTRVAVSDFRMWQDIALTNTQAIKYTLERLIHYTQELIPKLPQGEFADFFAQAKDFIVKLHADDRR